MHYSKEELSEMAKAMAFLNREMEKTPFKDQLGTYYSEIAAPSTVAARGEFYTPQSVGTIMAKMSVDPLEVIEKGQPITVSDPCSGSGGLILSLAELFAPQTKDDSSYVDLIRATCIDLNPIAADMCYINTTLWGIPSRVFCGNTLSRTGGTELGWKNIHWARVGEDQRQATERTVARRKEILSFTEREEQRREPKAQSPAPSGSVHLDFGQDGDQMTFGL